MALIAPDTIENLLELDQKHLLHPQRGPEIQHTDIIVRGDGCRVWTADGRELLDATSGGLWASLIGHGRGEIAQAAADQMRQLEYFTSFWSYANEPSILAAAKIADLAPDGLETVFYASGGSEANESAIKLARNFHYRRGEPDRTWILSRNLGYHGVAYGSGTVTGLEIFREGFGPLMPHVEHVTSPWPYQVGLYGGQSCTDFLLAELEQTIERLGPEKISAMIGEPVIGVGGVLVPPDDYWPRVRALLREHGILLIADEVVTGFGRSGHWFASEPLGMEPDLVTFAKGVTSAYFPLGGVVMRRDIADAATDIEEGFHHGFTYFGHPVGCAVALANIEVLDSEGLLSASTRIGESLSAELAHLVELPRVGEIRHYGSMVSIEFVADKDSRKPLFVRGAADALQGDHAVIGREIASVIAVSPPLVMTQEQVKVVAAALADVAARVGPDGAVS